MEQGIPVPDRLSLDFQQELVENIDQIHYLNTLISQGRKKNALEFIHKEGVRLTKRYTKICYYGMSYFTKDIPKYPLNEAAAGGDVDIMKALILIGFDPKVRNKDILTAGCRGESPLCCAAEKGHLHLVQLLVEDLGADVNEKDGLFEDTPLHYASRAGSFEVVQYLVEKGASVNARNSLNHLPVFVALIHHDIAKYLIANGTDVKLMDNTEVSLLYYACRSYGICECLETIRLILKGGANANNGSVLSGESPLCLVASNNWLDLMKLLIAYGADPELGDRYGRTPLHRTTGCKNTSCAHYLIIDLCVGLDKKSNDRTPFAMAVAEGNPNFLTLILDAGYDPVNEDCIFDNENGDLAEVLEQARYLACNPRPLQDLCCFRVRQILGRNIKRDVSKLSLPTVLKDLIQLTHVLPYLD